MCIFNSIANELKIKNLNYLSVFNLDLDLLPYSNFSLSHNSIRHRRIFDIIELLKRSIIKLQIKSLCIYFEN